MTTYDGLDDRPGPSGLPALRQGHARDATLERREHDCARRRLQIELLTLLAHPRDTGQKVALLPQVDHATKDHDLVGRPAPLIVGPVARVHEDDEDPARFFPSLDEPG